MIVALKAAGSGDTILLESGTYTNLNLRDFKFDGIVTIASKDPQAQAVLGDLTVRGSEGLQFSNLEFAVNPDGLANQFQVLDSQNVHFSGLNVHGSADGAPSGEQAGLMIRNSSDVSIRDSEFQQLKHGVSFLDSDGVVISGNSFHDLQVDGVRGGGTSNLKISNNTFTDFYPEAGDHPDGIQLWTTNTTKAAHDIVITGNAVTRGDGAPVQGIFLRDQLDALPYQNVTIADNIVIGGLYNGIMVDGGVNIRIDSNIVASYADQKSWVRMENVVSGSVTNNEAFQYLYINSSDGLIKSGNIELAAVSDGGVLLLNEWLKFHDLQAPDLGPDSVVPAPAPVAPAEVVMTGTMDADRLVVSGQTDIRVEAGDGNDVITGGAGRNTLVGGGGDDTYIIRDHDDVVVEAVDEGLDTVAASVDYTLTDNVEALRLVDGARVGVGNVLSNKITGSEGDDKLSGLGGEDKLYGGLGNDLLLGGEGDDDLQGQAGKDWLEGGAGKDKLYGGEGGDVLVGGDGDDLLDGGAGSDTMVGGAGADFFQYKGGDFVVGGGGVMDRIESFSSSQGDRIFLTTIDANLHTVVNDKFAFVGAARFSGKAGELRYEVSGNDVFVFGDVNGDGVSDLQIHITGVTSVSASDFML